MPNLSIVVEPVVFNNKNKQQKSIKFKNIRALDEAVESLEIISKKREQVIRALNKYKAYALALKGSKDAAIQLITSEINQYPEQNQKKIIRKIEELSSL